MSAVSEHPFHQELEKGCTTLCKLVEKVDTAQKQAVSEQAVKSLSARIEDWKGIDVADLGRLVLSDVLYVERGTQKMEQHIFLFQHHLLFCDETQGPPSSPKIGWKKRVTSPARERSLTIAALTPINDIIRVIGSEQREGEEYSCGLRRLTPLLQIP